MSIHKLNEDVHNVLERGLNFSIAPRHIPMEEIICLVEDSINALPEHEAEEVRLYCVLVLINSTPPNLISTRMNREH